MDVQLTPAQESLQAPILGKRWVISPRITANSAHGATQMAMNNAIHIIVVLGEYS